MALGDLISRDGQIEWGDILIDFSGFDAGDGPTPDVVVPRSGIEGLDIPAYRTTRIEIPASPGSFAGLDMHGTRTIKADGVQVDGQSQHAKVLAAMAPRGPSSEQEIAWRGGNWPTERTFRAFARPLQPGGKFDSSAAIGGMRLPDLSWECPAPYAYDLAPQSTGDLAPGATHSITSPGNWPTTRIVVTWTGVWTHPGISTSAVDGGVIRFPTLTMTGTNQIVAKFYAYTERTLASNHFTTRQLWADALGDGPSAASPPPSFFPILPGAQTLTVLGTGSGTCRVDWFDAYASPPMP